MIICTSKKTKEISQHQAAEKEYLATLKLGATTPSYDGETEETYFYPKHISKTYVVFAIVYWRNRTASTHFFRN